MTNDITKRQMSWPQRRASAFCWQCFCDLKQLPIGNKTVISRLLGKQSNHCPSVVEKILETVALGLQPLSTVSQIFSTTEGQWFDCSPHSHEITVYCPLRTYCLLEFFLLVSWPWLTVFWSSSYWSADQCPHSAHSALMTPSSAWSFWK